MANQKKPVKCKTTPAPKGVPQNDSTPDAVIVKVENPRTTFEILTEMVPDTKKGHPLMTADFVGLKAFVACLTGQITGDEFRMLYKDLYGAGGTDICIM